MTPLRSPYDLSPSDLAALAAEAGQPAWRAGQLAHWLDRRRVTDPLAMTDLPRGFRERLADRLAGTGLEPRRHQVGDGGWTHKLLFGLPGGDSVESVLMLYPGRATVCVSTQAGCAMGCTFCATGQFGFTRNLSARAITISTVGLVPGIRRAAVEPLAVNLAVSIHAPDDELRDRLVPVNRSWPIADLLDAVRGYVEATRRRVSFEYALMRGVNDGVEQGRELGRLLAPLRVPGSGGHAAHVNVIPYNATPGTGFSAPSRSAVRRFRDAVAGSGVPVSVRANRGAGIDAACGQLRTMAGRPGRAPAPPLVTPGTSG